MTSAALLSRDGRHRTQLQLEPRPSQQSRDRRAQVPEGGE